MKQIALIAIWLAASNTLTGQGGKSSSSEWNFADEMGSLALANVLSCSSALHTKAPARFQSAFDRPMDHSKTGTVESLRVAYDYCIDGLATMDDASLLEMAAFAGHPAMRLDLFWNANAHATYRLGEAEMHLHLKGIIKTPIQSDL